jgi:hypothetical protein
MSDNSTTDPGTTSAALRDGRRIAIGVWVALLVTLLVTSWAGLGANLVTTGLNDSVITYLTVALSGSGKTGVPETIATAALALTVAIAGALVLAWMRFAQATRQMLDGLDDASGGPDTAPATSYWLPAGETNRSELLDLLTFVGVAWGLIILRPVVIGTLQVFLV